MKIYLGITGLPASGKGVVKDLLIKYLEKQGIKTWYWSISDAIRLEVKKTNFKRSDLLNTSVEFKKIHGPDVFAKKTIEYFKALDEVDKQNHVAIFESIKSSDEVKYFKSKLGRRFVLLGIKVDNINLLIDRISKRNRNDENESVLINRENARKLILSEYGIKKTDTGIDIAVCLNMASHIIVNDSNLENLNQKVEKLVINDLVPLILSFHQSSVDN